MSLIQNLPLLAGLCIAAFLFYLAGEDRKPHPNAWIVPALFCTMFLGWSLFAVISEGLFGFWTEHTRNIWGVQIWFDLLLAISIALTFLIPEARRVGMRPLPWIILILCTGSIGILAMMSRLLFLRDSEGSVAG
jgi:hypothetical protein